MKLLFLLFFVAIIASAVYFYSAKLFKHSKKQKKFSWKPVGITAGVTFILLGLIVFGMYKTATQSDLWCSTTHTTTSIPPTNLKSATDYFLMGNYDYDTGNCQKAIENYTKAISLNSKYTESYNNRAYTNMRLRNYKDALPDLDKAIMLNPNYVQALMNRGDIHNYYYQIDRQAAISDYKKVITLTGGTGGDTSACGHLFLARHNGWNLGTFVGLITGEAWSCR